MRRAVLASVLGLTLCAATTATTCGQGTVLFDNFSGPNEFQVLYGSPAPVGHNSGDVVSDTSVIIGLYAGANGSSTSALQLIATTPIFVDPDFGGGWYSGGAAAIPSTLFTGTQTVEFQVRGWRGTDYASATLKGASDTWLETPASAGGSLVALGLSANEMLNGPLPLELSGFAEPLQGPLLTIIPYAAYAILTWPTNATGFTLQSTTNLVSPAVWTTVSPGPIVLGGQNLVINPISGTKKFYRLIQ